MQKSISERKKFNVFLAVIDFDTVLGARREPKID